MRASARDAPRAKPLLRERRRLSRDLGRIWVSVDLESDRGREFEAFPGSARATARDNKVLPLIFTSISSKCQGHYKRPAGTQRADPKEKRKAEAAQPRSSTE
jgi:hypothetical protein